jgi:O-methyltransferase
MSGQARRLEHNVNTGIKQMLGLFGTRLIRTASTDARQEQEKEQKNQSLADVPHAPAEALEMNYFELYEYFQHNKPDVFPSVIIHSSSQNTIRNFAKLYRGYDDELQSKLWIQAVSPWTMVTYDGLVSLAEQVRYCEDAGIEGDFVETGTHRGGALGLMALANLKYGKSRRTLHGFDSFEGIPWPDSKKDDLFWIQDALKLDLDECNGQKQAANRVVGTRDEFDLLFNTVVRYSKEHLKVHQGWFQDTVPVAAKDIDKIAILRLDGDLYDSTKVCLDHLFPKVVDGGFVVIDDWCLKGARTAVEDYLSDHNLRPFINLADGAVRYFIK